MNSLAITDSLLLIVTFLIAYGAKHPPSIRIAAGLFAAAAFLGVLRFTGILPLPTMHSFFLRLRCDFCVSVTHGNVPFS